MTHVVPDTVSRDPVSRSPGEISGHRLREAERRLAEGDALCGVGQLDEAEKRYRASLALSPSYAMAFNNLGWVREAKGDPNEAVVCYRRALSLDPKLSVARRNLAPLLVRLGRREESLPLFHEALAGGEEAGTQWLHRLIAAEMSRADLSLAGEFAAVLASLKWGSTWRAPFKNRGLNPPILPPQVRQLTIPKLAHDIEQFTYLQERGVLGQEFDAVKADYQSLIELLTPRGGEIRVLLEGEWYRRIGHVYNRIINVRDTPRVRQALSPSWDRTAVQRMYLELAPGVVVIDNFLTSEALDGVQRFCVESTVWSGNRYAHGRFGAFFHDGFNCPLLLQISEELRRALPSIIVDRYPLRQLWGFKNGSRLPGDSTTHADFAAVNVNFWITPESANLDPTTGGLVVYGVDAPLHWDFATYNGRSDIIKPFLKQQEAKSIVVPYKQNRAIIFNSDLFHGTQELNFRPGYENRRINVTMLYGDRENDVHHRELARPDPMSGANPSFAQWRSGAFARSRRSRG
jgi:tetratricopeptide (TPR) repeat protein